MSIDEISRQLEDRLSSNGGLDYITLKESSSIITRIAGIILGLLTWFILIVFPLVIAMEIMYICLPFMRSKADFILRKLEDRGADSRLLGLAFKDAKYAIDTVYSRGKVEGGTSDILRCYFWIKVKSIMFIFFLLCFVLQGSHQIIQVVWVMIKNLLEKLFY